MAAAERFALFDFLISPEFAQGANSGEIFEPKIAGNTRYGRDRIN